MNDGIGDAFQQETKYYRSKLSGGGLDWAKKPEPNKRYDDAPKMKLEPPWMSGDEPVWETIKNRRSVRRFTGRPVVKAELSQLLWATQGITARYQQFGFRAAPSAGALYPIETYAVVNRVDGLEPGIYHYEVDSHTLDQLRMGSFGEAAARAALDQDMIKKADVVFIWSAIFERSRWKYKQRAYRYIYLDAGHIAQNLALAAVALDLGSCQIAAFYDDEVNVLLGLDGTKESAIYMSVVGRPK